MQAAMTNPAAAAPTPPSHLNDPCFMDMSSWFTCRRAARRSESVGLAEDLADARDQHFQPIAFADETVEPGGRHPLGQLAVRLARVEPDRARDAAHLPQHHADVVAEQLGDVDVEQDEVGLARIALLLELVEGRHRDDRVAGLLETVNRGGTNDLA